MIMIYYHLTNYRQLFPTSLQPFAIFCFHPPSAAIPRKRAQRPSGTPSALLPGYTMLGTGQCQNTYENIKVRVRNDRIAKICLDKPTFKTTFKV